mmetsp:Transcript_27382/g.49785  ORF Transcript_27382/g.49785 Transcript_27382/m.49785 type:complete len:278 (+) Transcript_27382:1775-2608(+)
MLAVVPVVESIGRWWVTRSKGRARVPGIIVVRRQGQVLLHLHLLQVLQLLLTLRVPLRVRVPPPLIRIIALSNRFVIPHEIPRHRSCRRIVRTAAPLHRELIGAPLRRALRTQRMDRLVRGSIALGATNFGLCGESRASHFLELLDRESVREFRLVLVVQLMALIVVAGATSPGPAAVSFGIIAGVVFWRSHAIIVGAHVLMMVMWAMIPSSASGRFAIRCGGGGGDLASLVRSGEKILTLQIVVISLGSAPPIRSRSHLFRLRGPRHRRLFVGGLV